VIKKQSQKIASARSTVTLRNSFLLWLLAPVTIMLTVRKIVSDFSEAFGGISRSETENISRYNIARIILTDFHLLLLFIIGSV